MTRTRPLWGTEPLSWVTEAGAVFSKEVRTEWRTRVALSSVLLFAVGALTLIALALGSAGGGVEPEITAGLLWVVLFFTAATGLGRAFVQEEERGTALALRLTARATVVWAGKFAANAALLLALAALVTPVLLGMLRMQAANAPLLTCVVILGSIGIAAVFTTTSALVAQASSRGGLLAALSFPVLAPLLLAGVHGTKAALGVGNEAGRFGPGIGDVQVLASYAVIAITASLLLFDFVWSD